MLNDATTTLPVPRARATLGPERLGVLAKVVAALVFCVIVAGSLVTSTRSGDADPNWPYFGEKLLPSVGDILQDRAHVYEYSHRLLVGLLSVTTLVFVVVLWNNPCRRGASRGVALTTAGLLLAIAVLGGLRVLLPELTWIPIVHVSVVLPFFCLVSAVAVVTGKRWQDSARELESGKGLSKEDASWLVASSLASTIAIYAQAVLGAVPRHLDVGTVPHILWAFAVFTIIVLVASRVLSKHSHLASVFRPSMALLFLTLVQFFLGFTTYVVRPVGRKAPGTGFYEAISSLHLAVGALLLIAAVVLTVHAFRLRWLVQQSASHPEMQGVTA